MRSVGSLPKDGESDSFLSPAGTESNCDVLVLLSA